MTQNPLRKLYDPVGRCIYCGATTYAPDSARLLATEHIIPEALSGTRELPQASCRRCERAINPWETKLLLGMLLGSRTHLGLQTKRPKDRPGALPLFDTSVTPNRKMMVAIADYPINVLMTAYDTPSALSGAPFDRPEEAVWCHFLTRIDHALLARKYGLMGFATSSLDTLALCVTLAKIAHAYAVAELGLDSFIPTLPHFIMNGKHHGARRYYIGGIIAQIPPSSMLHEVAFEDAHTNSDWHVVRLRLLASIGAPVYRVVAGQKINATKSEAVPIAEADARRTSDRLHSAPEIACSIPTGLWDQPSPSADAPPAQGLPRGREHSSRGKV